MSAAERRAERDALSDEVLVAAAEDHERWFAEHPGRTAYSRLATEREVELAHLHAGWPTDPGRGLRYLLAVRRDALWIESRTFASADVEAVLALDDDGARILFSALSRKHGSGNRPFEARLTGRGMVVQ